MKTTSALVLSALVVSSVAAAAPAAAADVTDPEAAAVYCVYQDPIVVQGVTVYPGGKYCVPGP
jgi:hypothetical protein